MTKRVKGTQERDAATGQAGTREAGLPGTTGTEGSDTPLAGPIHRTAYDWFRENVEALLVAVILAIIIRHFAVEAFEIPTGSMANTLFGIHAWLECPNCPTELNAALQSDSSTGDITVEYNRMWVYDGECPNPACTLRLHSRGPEQNMPLRSGARIFCSGCRTVFDGKPGGYRMTDATEREARCPICHHVYHAVIEKQNKTGGHKILVTKFAYAMGKPERWDVIVFGFDQWKNYIKRLVGLPGERLNVWDGDLYVDGSVERKSRHPYVQDVLWTKIADSEVAERGLNPIPAWEEVAPDNAGRGLAGKKNAQWNPALKRWSLNAAGDIAILEYRRGFENYYNYNLLTMGTNGNPIVAGPDRRSHPAQVGDKKVAFTVKVASGAPRQGASWVGAQIRDGDFTFQLRIPVASASEANPAVIERAAPMPAGAPALRASVVAAIPAGSEARVELENADDRVAAKLDGQEILSIEYTSFPEGASFDDPPIPPADAVGAHQMRLIACGAQAEIVSIQVYRDMYYIPRNQHGLWRGIQLGPGEYFAMGDNAPSSSDGRYWDFIPEKNLMGKALLVFWPAWPVNFQCKFIR